MWGGSYAGWNQWATAGQHPPHLKTIVPAAAVKPGIDFPHYKNIFYLYEMRWTTLTSGLTNQQHLFDEEQFWVDQFREMYLNHRPFAELDQAVGNPSTYFGTCKAHPTDDPYLDSVNPSDEGYAGITCPVLTITGHFDGDQWGALEHYLAHLRNTTPEAAADHYLIIGPWDHAGTRTPKKEVGGMTFDARSELDLNKLHEDWYNWVMKGGEKPEFLKKRVAYYVGGAEEWRYADDLDSIAEYCSYYLDSLEGRANDAFQSGMLRHTAPDVSMPDSFVYDPLDTRPEALDREPVPNFLTDQRYALNLYGNGLVYHSAPFDQAVEMIGQPRLSIYLAMDVPDTDFRADLHEIRLDGSSILLATDMLRARYRESRREARLVTPGSIECYTFDWFAFNAQRITAGSRLRLVFTCNNSVHWQKNYNSGGNVLYESARDARTAHITVYHDAQHPSCIEIPVARKE
jgi:uncharacterized protein